MSKAIWMDNSVQFPRLIAELEACGTFTPEVLRALSERMELSPPEVRDLIGRAQGQWESIKRMHCPPSQAIVRCTGCGNEIEPDVCHCGELVKSHDHYSNHSPVPLGCDCGRATKP